MSLRYNTRITNPDCL